MIQKMEVIVNIYVTSQLFKEDRDTMHYFLSIKFIYLDEKRTSNRFYNSLSQTPH